MAVHAGLGRRHVRETRGLDAGMATAAVHPKPAHMVRVAERHWLFAHLRSPRFIAGTVQLRKDPRQKAQNKNCAKNRDSRERVSAVTKYLGHTLTSVPTMSK